MSEKKVFSYNWGGRQLQVEIGQLAKQANGAVLVRYGDTVVLTAAVGTKQAKDTDFFPLTVNYEEKMYAAGKIPGGFIKREGRPSEHATLTARLIDRPIRPMFAEGFRNEVQITNTVMSVDPNCPPEMAAMFGSSLALCISDIPFDGPIAGVDVGRVNGEYVINPTTEQKDNSDIELSVAGTATAINMVESSAKEVNEEDMLGALLFGHEEIKKLVAFQEEIVREVGKEKMEVTLLSFDPAIEAQVKDLFSQAMVHAIQTQEKLAREANIEKVKETAIEHFEAVLEENDEKAGLLKQVSQLVDNLEKDEVRRLITEEKVRPDGRKIDEIRPLSSEIDLLPRVHGSGLFTRGQTQALTSATLAPLGEYQVIDGLGIEEGKRFIHHYNFPQFSVGSVGRAGSPGRREIGHGALGERALKQVIPSPEDFPYTIRLVSEVLESNGSSSQASICAGTLALMAAGVPIKAPVAGIAMGLISDGTNYTVLTDIQGLEDHLGDMDFKVAGTKDGITALQMDIKIQGITEQILREALTQAKKARFEILEELTSTIAEPRKELSPYAPKIEMISIHPDKIKVVIGRGGETINSIIDETGVKIDIDQEGHVSIASTDAAMIQRAKEIIEDLTREIEVGQVYEGTVRRIEKFGAFVEIAKGKDGLVHISELAHERVGKVEDVLALGDKVTVKVIEIDGQGRINLSRKVLLPKEDKE
ncbi:polyribonucleotide nucleotidyltransferase [Granulicatella adiacens ATCC 49175]|uniref:Polyribonucleotide nucleotidyltransferase n=1 Tax=Granulicatella adiacens ATCC 49175 TaxID=638301 RepID=C8NFP4_9LACT|nr:polyribonucleotide nucleotidyltransferase [Granulicatella adiacens]EEW37380.1 polyribonucleotide nucleotidyltransferase [Granulicatella adiacens ATCC 49175]UAK93411.1 polyribonucleotide nucleotidyltransferase [Granulicatella adiacens]UWP37591.1 polyribonucleotide nucleotidyltransferase [Granulicatella adiacens ATCC 49175]